jgi:RNA polymerase sigma-70 factor (ECF subfamily)
MLSLWAGGCAKLRAYDPGRGRSLPSYIGMLATHCAYDWLRATRREPVHEALATATELSSESADPFEATAWQERADIAARVMRGFSARDRAFAMLYFGEALDPAQIARSMKISVKTVYSKKHKLEKRLRGIVARWG